jgi:hypothetical protein
MLLCLEDLTETVDSRYCGEVAFHVSLPAGHAPPRSGRNRRYANIFVTQLLTLSHSNYKSKFFAKFYLQKEILV